MKETPDNIRATSEELTRANIYVRTDSSPETRDIDLLERYRAVPNHAIFLFSSADAVLDNYIRKNWWELDGLSGDSCDIHVSMMQLFGDEDVYTQLDDVRTIPGLSSIDPSQLPFLHIWSDSVALQISLTSFNSESILRDALRLVFGEIRREHTPLERKQANQLGRSIQRLHSQTLSVQQQIRNVHAGRDIVQITHNYFGKDKMHKNESANSKSNQSMSDVKLSGKLRQTSDASKARQTIKQSTGLDAEQSVRGQKQNLSLGRYSASGIWAVVGLVIFLIVGLLFKLLAG